MKNIFYRLKNQISKSQKIIINILNYMIIVLIFCYTILFYFNIKNIYLSNFIISLSLIIICLKLFYYVIAKNFLTLKQNKSKIFLLHITIGIFTYLTPAYYIFKQNSLVMNEDIIFITLVIVSIIASIGIIIEKHLVKLELQNTFNINHENKSN